MNEDVKVEGVILSPILVFPSASAVPVSDRRAILGVIAKSAFRHPQRHRLVATTMNADARFAFVALHPSDEQKQVHDDREIRRFFDTEGNGGAETEFFLRKAAGTWRILYWMPVVSEGAPIGLGYVFDYRPLMATGFPALLSPGNLRRTWATKWIYTKEGVVETIVTDVAQLDRNRETMDSFPLDGSTVYRRGLRRP